MTNDVFLVDILLEEKLYTIGIQFFGIDKYHILCDEQEPEKTKLIEATKQYVDTITAQHKLDI